jgi:hypothetical protein
MHVITRKRLNEFEENPSERQIISRALVRDYAKKPVSKFRAIA